MLTQERQADLAIAAIEMEQNIVAIARARPEFGNAARGQPFFIDDPRQHRLRIDPQRARAFADHGIVEDRRIIARQLPRTEERGPVDILRQIGEIPRVKDMATGLFGRRRLVGKVRRKGVVARLFEGEQL